MFSPQAVIMYQWLFLKLLDIQTALNARCSEKVSVYCLHCEAQVSLTPVHCTTCGKGMGSLLKSIGKILGNGESCKEAWCRVK